MTKPPAIDRDAGDDDDAVSERVQEILDNGARIFAEKGFDATSMRDIAEACRVSKALLYHHFDNKDGLYARIAFDSTRKLYRFVAERVPEDGPASEKIRCFMVAMATFFEEHRWVWIAASTAFWNDPDRYRLKERLKRRRAFELLLRSLIQEGIDSGEFRELDVAMTGRLILSSINWMQRWYNPRRELRAAEIAEIYFDTMLGGMLRRA